MAALERSEQKPILLVAAESIAASTGMLDTVADLVRGRALRHYGEGLRQYLAIRLQSRALALRGFDSIRDRIAGMSTDALSLPPGPRAHLYRMARQLAVELRACAAAPDASQRLTWHMPRDGANDGYLAALEQVRRKLDPFEAELLELRYARELSPEELAFVVELEVDEVVTRLEQAAEHARSLLGPEPPSQLGGLRGALQEAFALSRPRADPKHVTLAGRASLPRGTVIGERYEIDDRVGEGSFGDVYRAFDADVPGHVVALKLLHSAANTAQARKSALRELRLIASVFHPSVVDFKDHGWFDSRLWFVMPWYDGETLEERIARAPLSRREAYEIFVPLAQALATMHAAGIRHQDIKPDNIFLARIGSTGVERARILPVLIDLGVAAKEAEMIVAGTPLYFAPEVAAQYASKPTKHQVSGKADVFSLALSLRNALEPSTQEQVPGTAIEAFIAHRAEHPPGAPNDQALGFLAPLFERCLSVDPEVRPNAEQLAKELDVLTRPERDRERRRATMRWAVPLSVASAVLLGLVTYVYLQERVKSARARIEVEATREDLVEESGLRRALLAGHEKLRESYATSLLTGRELSERAQEYELRAERLGAAVTQLKQDRDVLRQELDVRLQTLASAQKSLLETHARVEAGKLRVTELEAQVRDVSERVRYLDAQLSADRNRLVRSEQELNETRTRARTLVSDLDDARQQLAREHGRAAALERSLLESQQERADAQRQLADERRRTAELTRQLRRPEEPHEATPPGT